MSVLVAGRVDEETKEKADAYIRRAGLTTSDVIRIVWTGIAETGQVPTQVGRAADSKDSLSARMRKLRKATPRSEFLENLTPEGVKEELSRRD